VKERPILFSGRMVQAILDGRKTMTRRVFKTAKLIPTESYGKRALTRTCPYGQPGDRLWVRETHNTCGEKPFYRADGEMPLEWKWSPSVFMPRWASRITLEITAVWVERLKDITIEDAQAEGITPLGTEGDSRRWRAGFRELWDSLNAKRGYGWDANPWVWVISFKRVK
jgi:hypothetical protein